MNIGDLVRYKNSEFVTTRVHNTQVGLVIKKESKTLRGNRTVCVKWTGVDARFQIMWHDPDTLEAVDESR